MVDAFDDLLNDRPFVQICRHIVGSGARQLNPAGMGLMVGLGAFESWQKGVVDIDRSAT